MNRKLLLLNAVLLGAAVYGGIQFHRERVAARTREAAVIGHRVPAAPAPPASPIPTGPPVVPATYQDVATHTLFDESRNPTVELPPPPPPPKPPDPPPLPSFYGSMNIGDGPVAMMSIGGGRQQGIHMGGMIGEFKLLDFNRQEIALEWNGQTIRKRVEELKADADTGPARTGPGQRAMPGVAPAALPEPKLTKMGPGEQSGPTMKRCQPEDNSAAGTVMDGYKKVVLPGLFGNTCYWEAVK